MKIVELQSVGSTNDHAKELAKKGAPAGTVVWAHEQTAGRGRQGNAWVSNAGNLFMSMILHPKIDGAHIGQLSFLSSVVLAETLEELLPEVDIRLKWPNDLLIGGRKAAGILIETESGAPWAVVGIGVNVTHAPEGATCLKEAGAGCTAEELLQILVPVIERRAAEWQKKGFGPVRDAWLKRAYKIGQPITARLARETLSGIFEGIDPMGALLLKMPDGTMKTINSGEVFI